MSRRPPSGAQRSHFVEARRWNTAEMQKRWESSLEFVTYAQLMDMNESCCLGFLKERHKQLRAAFESNM